MPRRREVPKRDILPDPKYKDQTVAKFINTIMSDGKKSVAERIMYGALDTIESRGKGDPVEVFNVALEKVSPTVEVKSRRWVVLPIRCRLRFVLHGRLRSQCVGWLRRHAVVVKKP